MENQKNEDLNYERANYDDMTDDIMNDLLIELYNSNAWAAILRFSDIRTIMADNVLRSIDPFKNPTETARNQGFISGSKDLEAYIIGEMDRRKKAEKS